MPCLDDALGFPMPKGLPDKFQGEWWNLHYSVCSQCVFCSLDKGIAGP